MQRYRITATGIQPLIMHADNIEWADEMEKWKLNKDNKASSKAGDDRTPAWRWLGCLYHDAGNIVIPTANVMRCLMEAGAQVYVPGAKHGKTFKSQTQSGIMPTSLGWPLLLNGQNKPLASTSLMALVGNKDFEVHKQVAIDNGFELFVKRVPIGQAKHIRVRPRYERWSITGELIVIDEQITHEVLVNIVEVAGARKGFCEWRPGGKTPGVYGTFRGEVEKIKD
jgi:hypothetical protein